jgi:large subunit ribosomal protein L28
VSHANNKTKRRWMPQPARAPLLGAGGEALGQAQGVGERAAHIDKNGIESVIAELRARGEKV